MSQAKVDRYKQEKKNRDKIIKKEKRQLAAMKAGVSVVAIALVAWVGVSVYHGLQSEDTTTAEKPSYTVNTSSLDELGLPRCAGGSGRPACPVLRTPPC